MVHLHPLIPHGADAVLGFETTIILSINPSLTFFFFQLILRLLNKNGRSGKPTNPGPGVSFIGGVVANSIGRLPSNIKLSNTYLPIAATIILYPLILAKTRLQTCRTTSKGPTGFLGTICKIYSERGIPGLYQGLEAQLLKGCLNQGVGLWGKSRIEGEVLRVSKTK